MHGTLFTVLVFVVSLYAALAVGMLYHAYREDRARRVAIARLNWRGTSQTEVEQPGWSYNDQPGWTDQQIAAFERRETDYWRKEAARHEKRLRDPGSDLISQLIGCSINPQFRDNFVDFPQRTYKAPWDGQPLIDHVAVDGPVTMLGNEYEDEQERRLR